MAPKCRTLNKERRTKGRPDGTSREYGSGRGSGAPIWTRTFPGVHRPRTPCRTYCGRQVSDNIPEGGHCTGRAVSGNVRRLRAGGGTRERNGPDAVAGVRAHGQAGCGRESSWVVPGSVQNLPPSGESDTAHLHRLSYRFDPPIPVVRGPFPLRTSLFFFLFSFRGRLRWPGSSHQPCLSRLVARRGRSDKACVYAGERMFAERYGQNCCPAALLSMTRAHAHTHTHFGEKQGS